VFIGNIRLIFLGTFISYVLGIIGEDRRDTTLSEDISVVFDVRRGHKASYAKTA
jgi:hypothetical protein